jgi:two-component system, NtrC family, sensor kinase
MTLPAPPKPYRTLRAKGLAATLALLAYVAATGAYVAGERAALYRHVQALEQLARHEQALALADAALRAALREAPAAPGAGAPPRLDDVTARLAALEAFDPAHVLLERTIERARTGAGAASLHEALARSTAALEIRRSRLADEHAALAAAFQRAYDAITVQTMLLAIVGLAAFGTLAAWFFGGLSRDIRRLERHAQRIVQGTRGVTLPVRRSDELGQLMRAVDRMADELDEREQRIALDGQRHSHQDKMLAAAALAAGVAHEVNNPLAVIAGTAQQLRRRPARRARSSWRRLSRRSWRRRGAPPRPRASWPRWPRRRRPSATGSTSTRCCAAWCSGWATTGAGAASTSSCARTLRCRRCTARPTWCTRC